MGDLLELKVPSYGMRRMIERLNLNLKPSKKDEILFQKMVLEGSVPINNKSRLHTILEKDHIAMERHNERELNRKGVYYRMTTPSPQHIHVIKDNGNFVHEYITILCPRRHYEGLKDLDTFIFKPKGIFKRNYH